MTSIFKDFDKSDKSQQAALTRFVNTPTVELLYETDKKAVDAFLDGDTPKIKEKAQEISNKAEKARTGAEQLYLRVAEILPDVPTEVAGTEGLFGTVWGLIKRFLNMIGNFFKWLGETFFGFGKRSETDFNKLQAKFKAGEINFDKELHYPANVKNLIDGKRYKALPGNLDWMATELDFLIKRSDNVVKSFSHAKELFGKMQNKAVTLKDVERFAGNVATCFNGSADGKEFRIVSSLFGTATKGEDGAVVFAIAPAKQLSVTEKSAFTVSEAKYESLLDKLEKTSKNLTTLANLSKQEGTLFAVKLKREEDLSGIGKAEAYALAAAFKTLVSFIGFIKHVMTAIQHADTAAHDVMSKAFQ